MKQLGFIALATAIALTGCGVDNKQSEFYDLETPLKAHSEELKEKVIETRKKYEAVLKQIEESAKTSVADVILKIDEAIATDNAAMAEQQAVYDENCTTEELRGGDQCNDIKEGIVNIQNVIKGSENKKKNIMAQAENAKNNNIAAHKAKYKNNLLKLAEQGGVKLYLADESEENKETAAPDVSK